MRAQTETDFIAAFWRLYAEKPLAKIPIQTLCQVAGYNRTTFYNHFDNIYDLFNAAVDTLFASVREKIFALDDVRQILEGDRIEHILLSLFEEKNQYIDLLFRRGDGHLLTRRMQQTLLAFYQDMAADDADTDAIALVLEYQCAAVLGVVGYWYDHDKPISEQAMLREIYHISANGVLSVLRERLSLDENVMPLGDAHA